MKKTYQIWNNVTVPAKNNGINGELVISDQLKENYTKATGFFIVPTSALKTDLSGLSLFLKIAQNEVLPKGTDASLVAFNGNVERDKVVYDFSKDNIPAKSSDIDLILTNTLAQSVSVNVYVVLENE